VPATLTLRHRLFCLDSYAVLNHVTDYDSWRESEKPVDVQDVIRTMTKNVDVAKASITNAIKILATEKSLQSAAWVRLVMVFVRKSRSPHTSSPTTHGNQ